MQRLCDVCRERVGTLTESVVSNGKAHEYFYCEECYQRIVKAGQTPHVEAQASIDRIGKECRVCNHTIEEFEKTFLLGCANCYDNMREIAINSALKAQGIDEFNLKHCYTPCDVENCHASVDKDYVFKSADESDEYCLTCNNVVSSRIRLARNIRGLNFPKYIRSTNNDVLELINGCKRASDKVFKGSLLTMNSLSKEQKKALIERHLISLPLANNTSNGAVILQGDKKQSGMSIMINEEDHVREQCILDGYDLDGVYYNIKKYDEALLGELNIAYDKQLGFLTACPTNLGTGMRASVMLFLPALKRAGAIEDALKTFKNEFGITIRGVFGEGSDAAYDMYQISNSRTLCVSEREIIEQVKQATLKLCYLERVALERLVRKESTRLFDGIARSYALLCSAYTLSSEELMRLLIDVKIGVILGLLPIKNVRKLNELIWACTPSSLHIITGSEDAEQRGLARARLVRQILAEEK